MQLPESLIRSTQTPLQSVVPEGHTQLPLEQTLPPVQGKLHPPQCNGSLLVSTHCDSQIACPASQTSDRIVPLSGRTGVGSALVQAARRSGANAA